MFPSSALMHHWLHVISQSDISALLAPIRNTVAPTLFAPAVQLLRRPAWPFSAAIVALSRVALDGLQQVQAHVEAKIRCGAAAELLV